MMHPEEEDIKSGSLYHKEGPTVLARNPTWHERWFVLSGNFLFWFKNSKDAIGPQAKRKKSKGSFHLPRGAIIRLDPNCPDAPFKDSAFHIQMNGQTLTLCAHSKDQTVDWIHVLESAIAGRKDLNRETVIIQEELRKADFDIPPEDLEFREDENDLIGAGASGIVRKGIWLKTTEVAVKALKNVPEFTDAKEMTQFYKEIETLSKLRHLNIVQMFGFCRKENYICLVTEFVKGGNLSDCLKNPTKYPLDFARAVDLATNIVRGMVYLHSLGLIHRDLKPANILIENWFDAKVKVCDFGISRVMRAKQSDATLEEAGLGSPQYAAPELTDLNHDNKVDVFSFAIILFELAVGETPWPDIKYGWEFAEKYVSGDRPLIPIDCSFGFLIKKCWAQQPADRPSFQQVYKDLESIQKDQAGVHSRQKAHTLEPFASPPLIRPDPFATRSMVLRSSNGLPMKISVPPPTKASYGLPTGRSSTNIQILRGPPPQRTNNFPSPVPSSLNPGPLRSLPGRSPLPSPNSSPLASPQFQLNGSGESSHVGPSQPVVIHMNTIESAINRVFDTKAVEAWTIFANAFMTNMLSSPAQMDKLRYIFDTRQGGVEKATWLLFLQWFTPLSCSDVYNTNGAQSYSTGGYEMDHILEICSPSFFHGFLDSKDAQRLLKGKPEGTFLLRFSTQQPGFYTLSVSFGGSAGHWRIACEKKPNEPPIFKVETRVYKSLDDVITTHRIGREPLKIKSPKPGQSDQCFLGSPFVRSESSDSYYQVV